MNFYETDGKPPESHAGGNCVEIKRQVEAVMEDETIACVRCRKSYALGGLRKWST